MSSHPTKNVVRMLTKAGWKRIHQVGSHSKWRGPNGTTFSLPDGHREISPGVYREFRKAMGKDAEATTEEDADG